MTIKILIAEDDTTTRLVLGATLKKLGHVVVAVENGRKAWDAWQQDQYSMLISDGMMPELSGQELCRMIRAEHSLQYTYIILLTALGGKGSYLEGMEAGADDFITKPFDQDYLAARLRVAERILALHETLRVEAMHDRLTGVLNRGAIMDSLKQELERSAREGTTIGIIMADLDHFKRINDSHGHQAGDAVLQEASRRMHDSLRPYDKIGRYGGEEFLIIVPSSNRRQTLVVAERIRSRINREPIQSATEALSVTVSLGAAVSIGARDDASTLIAAADAALYRAKDSGRNRAEFAERETA